MPLYVLNRDYVHHSTLGHSVAFKKNEPVYVPKIIEREVLRFGAESVEGGETPSLIEDAPVKESAPVDAGEMTELIEAAFAEIVERNNPEEFTAAGVPRVPAIEKIVGFDVHVKEINTLWTEYKAKLG